MIDDTEGSKSDATNVYALNASDPDGRLINRDQYSSEVVDQIGDLMAALAQLREAEQRLSDASQRYMQLGPTDMKALHFLIVAKNTGEIATPGSMARHLDISTASTTKLLDRLETGGHILRSSHPHDRRALAIAITDETYEAAVETVGRQQSKRFHAAARLTTQERDVVINFLQDMTQEISRTDDLSDPTDD